MSGLAVAPEQYDRQVAIRLTGWAKEYLRTAALVDFGRAIVGVFVVAQLRFGKDATRAYVALSLALPVLWLVTLWLAGGYDARYIGAGPDEFRKVLNDGVSLTAAIVLTSYAINLELSRSYLLIAVPSTTLLDPVGRYAIRKRLHRQRAAGRCVLSVVALGNELAIAELVTELRPDRYYGLTVVGACVAQPSGYSKVAGVPVDGGLDEVTAAVRPFHADALAALACPEIDAIKPMGLAWELEKAGTELCVSPALLNVAGPRIEPARAAHRQHRAHPSAMPSSARHRLRVLLQAS